MVSQEQSDDDLKVVVPNSYDTNSDQHATQHAHTTNAAATDDDAGDTADDQQPIENVEQVVEERVEEDGDQLQADMQAVDDDQQRQQQGHIDEQQTEEHLDDIEIHGEAHEHEGEAEAEAEAEAEVDEEGETHVEHHVEHEDGEQVIEYEGEEEVVEEVVEIEGEQAEGEEIVEEVVEEVVEGDAEDEEHIEHVEHVDQSENGEEGGEVQEVVEEVVVVESEDDEEGEEGEIHMETVEEEEEQDQNGEHLETVSENEDGHVDEGHEIVEEVEDEGEHQEEVEDMMEVEEGQEVGGEEEVIVQEVEVEADGDDMNLEDGQAAEEIAGEDVAVNEGEEEGQMEAQTHEQEGEGEGHAHIVEAIEGEHEVDENGNVVQVETVHEVEQISQQEGNDDVAMKDNEHSVDNLGANDKHQTNTATETADADMTETETHHVMIDEDGNVAPVQVISANETAVLNQKPTDVNIEQSAEVTISNPNENVDQSNTGVNAPAIQNSAPTTGSHPAQGEPPPSQSTEAVTSQQQSSITTMPSQFQTNDQPIQIEQSHPTTSTSLPISTHDSQSAAAAAAATAAAVSMAMNGPQGGGAILTNQAPVTDSIDLTSSEHLALKGNDVGQSNVTSAMINHASVPIPISALNASIQQNNTTNNLINNAATAAMMNVRRMPPAMAISATNVQPGISLNSLHPHAHAHAAHAAHAAQLHAAHQHVHQHGHIHPHLHPHAHGPAPTTVPVMPPVPATNPMMMASMSLMANDAAAAAAAAAVGATTRMVMTHGANLNIVVPTAGLPGSTLNVPSHGTVGNNSGNAMPSGPGVVLAPPRADRIPTPQHIQIPPAVQAQLQAAQEEHNRQRLQLQHEQQQRQQQQQQQHQQNAAMLQLQANSITNASPTTVPSIPAGANIPMSFSLAKGIGATGRVSTARRTSATDSMSGAGSRAGPGMNGNNTGNGNGKTVTAGTASAVSGGGAPNLNVDGDEKLVEVEQASQAANEVFTRVKSEKIAEQTLCSIRNDQAQYEGLAKEIVGKAIKQKERERANRASAAASRAKVLRYQTELESRLNRIEAERNLYRKTMSELREQLVIVQQQKENANLSEDAPGEGKSEPLSANTQPQEKKSSTAVKRKLDKLIEVVSKAQNINPSLVTSIVDLSDFKRVKEGEDSDQQQPQVVDLNNLPLENNGNNEMSATMGADPTAALLSVDGDGNGSGDTVGQQLQGAAAGSTTAAMAAAAAAVAVGASKVDVDEAEQVAKKRRLQEV